MSEYSDIVAQIEKRNAQRQEEWRAKALARRKHGGKGARGRESSHGIEDDEDEIDELPAHRRRRRRNQHLIPGTLRHIHLFHIPCAVMDLFTLQ